MLLEQIEETEIIALENGDFKSCFFQALHKLKAKVHGHYDKINFLLIKWMEFEQFLVDSQNVFTIIDTKHKNVLELENISSVMIALQVKTMINFIKYKNQLYYLLFYRYFQMLLR